MTFREDIAAIQATMAGCGATGEAGKPFAQPVPGLRESRRILDSLAAQFDSHIGSPVICLPMADSTPDVAHSNGDCAGTA